MKKCLYCGKEFKQNDIGRKKKYCCMQCKDKDKIKKYKKEKQKIIKLWPICNKKFETINENQIYCSKKCAATNRKYTKICINCNNEYISKQNNGKFCCYKCKYEWKKKTKATKIHKLICQQCGEEFMSQRNQQKYCSPECSQKSQIKKKLLEYICKNCGKKFAYRHGCKNIFCNNECFKDYKSKHTERYCEICGKELLCGQFHYCSIECKEKFKLTKYNEYICEYCGKTFKSKRQKKCCSNECSYKLSLKKEKLRRLKKFKSEIKICKYCGEEFYTQYKHSKTFCSIECAKKMYNLHTKDHNKKRKKLKIRNGKIHKDITLPKLYKKYKGVCAICGEKCNFNDYIINEQDIFIAGNNYPSIDHITALSNGGTHTWDNIQLAHRLCNSYKSDNFIEKKNGQLSIF